MTTPRLPPEPSSRSSRTRSRDSARSRAAETAPTCVADARHKVGAGVRHVAVVPVAVVAAQFFPANARGCSSQQRGDRGCRAVAPFAIQHGSSARGHRASRRAGQFLGRCPCGHGILVVVHMSPPRACLAASYSLSERVKPGQRINSLYPPLPGRSCSAPLNIRLGTQPGQLQSLRPFRSSSHSPARRIEWRAGGRGQRPAADILIVIQLQVRAIAERWLRGDPCFTIDGLCEGGRDR